ncbi:MAG TPA: signal peptidase II [Bacilli bacterium]|jgi:signal peptidase II|nr:signal peptidase II [Bacilli bacterium]
MKNNLLKRINWRAIIFSFYWLLVILLVIDQATKALFLHLEATQGPRYQLTIIENFFYFTYHRNTGAAWSILADYPWLLALISLLAASAMLTYRIMKRKVMTHIYKAAWAVVIAGTLGNFIDRAFYTLLTGRAGVVDFLHFQFGDYHFPIFNVADMCLVVGLIGLSILTFIDDGKEKKKAETTGTRDESNK